MKIEFKGYADYVYAPRVFNFIALLSRSTVSEADPVHRPTTLFPLQITNFETHKCNSIIIINLKSEPLQVFTGNSIQRVHVKRQCRRKGRPGKKGGTSSSDFGFANILLFMNISNNLMYLKQSSVHSLLGYFQKSGRTRPSFGRMLSKLFNEISREPVRARGSDAPIK